MVQYIRMTQRTECLCVLGVKMPPGRKVRSGKQWSGVTWSWAAFKTCPEHREGSFFPQTDIILQE